MYVLCVCDSQREKDREKIERERDSLSLRERVCVFKKFLVKKPDCSQFHQRYTRVFFVQIFQQSQNVTIKTTFVQKICTYNVDEIDTWRSKFVYGSK